MSLCATGILPVIFLHPNHVYRWPAKPQAAEARSTDNDNLNLNKNTCYYFSVHFNDDAIASNAALVAG